MGDAQGAESWEAAAGRRRGYPRWVPPVVLALAAVAVVAQTLLGERDPPPGQGLAVEQDRAPAVRTDQPPAGRRGVEALRSRPPLPPPTEVPLRPVAGTWSARGQAPLRTGPGRPGALWTGQHLVVTAGEAPGPQRLAAWARVEGTWQALEAPIPARSGPELVWTGGELIVLGGSGSQGRPRLDGAAWDPATGRWRLLPEAPGGVVAATWTGRRLHAWTRAGGRVRVHAYDPGEDTWRPAASRTLRRVVADGAGYARGRLVVWGRRVGTAEPAVLVGPTHVDVGAPPGFEPDVVAVAGDGIVALGSSGGQRVGAHFRLGRGWEPVPTMHEGATAASGSPASVWTGARLVITAGGTVVAYDPSTQRWEDYGAPPATGGAVEATVLGWTGDELLLLTAGGAGPAELHAWRPGG